MPAHLAGALGAPVRTLLASECDWRWMDAREETPWYPTMRLFRQPRPGEWEPVVEAVAAEIKRLAAARNRDGAVSRLESRVSGHACGPAPVRRPA